MKNYKLYIFFLFLIMLFSIQKVYSKNFTLLGKIFVIDPGHGGADPGAIYFKTRESQLNLKISLNLKENLEKKGAIVYLTRDGDYDLSSLYTKRRKKSDFDNRLKLINTINPDMVISVHMNAENTGKWEGLQVFYYSELSKKVSDLITKYTRTNRETKIIKDIYLLENIKQKTVLIEYGFISNYKDIKNLKNEEYITNLNKRIVYAIEKNYDN